MEGRIIKMEVKATVGDYTIYMWETEAGISLEVRKNKEDKESRGIHLLFTTEGQVKIYPRAGGWFLTKYDKVASIEEFLESFVEMKGNKEEIKDMKDMLND